MAVRETVVVTGGAGFLGSHLCERLLVDGYAVVCVDNLSTGVMGNVAGLGEIGPFEAVRADVVESFRWDRPVGAVLHFASPASPADYVRAPVATLKAGSVGTLNMLELAAEKRARFVLASSSEVYGEPQVHPQPESYVGCVDPVGVRSPYNEAKRFAESLTTVYRRRGVSTAIARIFNTFGPRMRPFDGRVVPTFVRQALARSAMTVAGDGRQTRTLQYVDDCVEGCVRLLHSAHGGPMNLGGVRECSVMDLAVLIRELAGSDSAIVTVARMSGDPSRRRPDISLARELLGWSPEVELADGLRKTIDWFRGVSA
jgi:dTDP-glucose 4,6-dehydratase